MERTWNRTKIICTIGPASSGGDVLEKMLAAGMDVARLNFSHGTHERHGDVIAVLRGLAEKLQCPLAVLMDLQGPRIRIGKFKDGRVRLYKGKGFTITTRDVVGDESIVSTSFAAIVKDVHAGDTILLSDGKIELAVRKVDSENVYTEVLAGGGLSDNKGMNIPNVSLSTQTITQKDIADIMFGVKMGVDYIAVSFVRSPGDIHRAREIVEGEGARIPLIAKIERPEAIENLDGIIDVSDGIMVARGDLGVELPPEDVPLHQKEIIKKANRAGVPVITATQMLMSMVGSTRPTRAEASDVANAIIDGTDAVMLSEETAAGGFPVDAVRMMSKIAEKVENRIPAYRMIGRPAGAGVGDTAENALGETVPKLAGESGARLICAFTRSGRTALKVSRNRPRVPIVGLTPDGQTYRRMNLLWGVEPMLVEEVEGLDAMTKLLDEKLKETGKASPGDDVVIIAGFPFSRGVHSNMLLLHTVE